MHWRRISLRPALDLGQVAVCGVRLCGYPVDDDVHVGCLQECLPPFTSLSVVLEPYANTGQTLSLYGQISTTSNCEGAFATSGAVTRVEPSLCLVGVESASWWEIKHLYR